MVVDVLIVGGGMVGASLAAALGEHPRQNHRQKSGFKPLRVAVIDSNPNYQQGEFGADGRASAIALGSSQIWQQIGVWPQMVDLGVTPMHTIQVSDGDSNYGVQLHREDMTAAALGYIVENRVTQTALWSFLQECPNVELICPAKVQSLQLAADGQTMTVLLEPTDLPHKDLSHRLEKLEAKLVIGADGGRSLVRQLGQIPISERHYNQTCIVVTLQFAYDHDHIAYERFQPSGPFAILPLGKDRACIVWTATQAETPHLLALDEAQFMAELKQRLGENLCQKLGHITLESRTRANYVPRWMHSQTYIQPRLALVGDAAHTTHPVAGQGMNLGIRDIAALAEILQNAHTKGEDIGSLKVLKRYQWRRQWDNLGVILMTDLMNRLFSSANYWLKLFRRMGLILLQLSGLKRILMYFMMGLHQVPDKNR
ncbi:MAG: FAD-dependent monooxygenase [Pseudanabaena sp. ELA607]